MKLESDPSNLSEQNRQHLLQNESWLSRNLRSMDRGSLRGVVLIWMRMTMGVGVLTLPYYVSMLGLTGGALALFLCTMMTYFSSMFILEATNKTNANDYNNLIGILLSKRLEKVFKFTYFIDLMIPMLVYTIVSWNLYEYILYSLGIMDMEWVDDPDKATFYEGMTPVIIRRGIYFAILFAALVPLLLKETLESLRWLSLTFLGVLAVLMIWILSEMNFFRKHYVEESELVMTWGIKNPGWEGLPIIFSILLCFYVQNYILNMRRELKNPSYRRTRKIATIALFSEFFIFIIFSGIVYVCLGDRFVTSLVILRKGYEGKNRLTELIFKALVFMFYLLNTIGIACFNPPIAENLMKYIKIRSKTGKSIIYCLPFFLSCILATALPSVITVFWIFGLTICNFNGFVIPLFLKIEILKMQNATSGEKLKYWILMGIYIAAGVAGVLIKVL